MLANFRNMIKKEFSGYNTAILGNDLLAGVTVAAVALPLALAFGIGSGSTAAAGLVTAILAGIIIGGLSGGSYQISGPTGAMAAVLISIVATCGMQGLFLACFLSGVILILAAVFKLGTLVSYIPAPVITGFTSGIAVIIALGQIDNFTGLSSTGTETLSKLSSYFSAPQTLNSSSAIIGIITVLIMVLYPKKLTKYCPSSLAAIVVITAANAMFSFSTPVVGEIPRTLFLSDKLTFSAFNMDTIQKVLLPSVSIAALGLIESLLCGASAGRMKNEKLDAGTELFAQGIGNIIIPFFGGIPATAAIARTSVAIKSGGKTRLTSIFHALILLLSMFVLSPVMSIIPLSALAGVLVVTAWRMNEWHTIKSIFRKKFYSAIAQFLITMIATVVFDLTAAIIIGIIVSALSFVIHISDMQVCVADVDKTKLSSELHSKHDSTSVIYVTGPLYFGTASKLSEQVVVSPEKSSIIFSMRGVPFADLSGTEALRETVASLKKSGAEVYFSCVQPKVMEMFRRCGIISDLGKEAFFWSTDIALSTIAQEAA